MASLQLSGLASGMDWQSVVEQLMELERFPIRRMEADKALNDQKSVELGILRTRMGTLKTAANALTNADLWNARSTELSDTDTTLISASAATGTLTGEYVISDATVASASVLKGQADITPNITTGSLLNALDVATPISTGTFSIDGTIFTISSTGGASSGTNIYLDDPGGLGNVASAIQAQLGGTYQVSIAGGRMHIMNNDEILVGHPDDTSNFLAVMKLFSDTTPVFVEEVRGTVATANPYSEGDYVAANDGSGNYYFYPVLQNAPAGMDLSTAPNAYFGPEIAPGQRAFTVPGISGVASDTFGFAWTTGGAKFTSVPFNTDIPTTLNDLAAAIQAADPANLNVSVSSTEIFISEKSPGVIGSSPAFTPVGTGTIGTPVEVLDGTQSSPLGDYHVRSEYPIGSIDVTQSISDALGIVGGPYSFDINGETFTVTTGADTTAGEIDIDNYSLEQFMEKVTTSGAGVTMSYNPISDQFLLTSKKTGSLKITTSDTTGNLLSTLNLDSAATATLEVGKDATLTINGTLVTSHSNDITGETHGIDGLTVSVKNDFQASDDDITITVASTTEDALSAVNSFISEYNSMQRHLESVTETVTTDSKVETSVFSDNLEVSNLISTLRYAVFGTADSINPVTMKSSGIERIQDIGIDFISGSAELQIVDSALLKTALSESGTLVKELFASSVDTPSFYSSTEAYSKGEVVEYDGVYWIALQATTGNSPPSHDGTTPSNNIDANWSFYAYDDDVARDNNTSDDHTGTPILNGLAYGMAYRLIEHIDNYLDGTTPNPDDDETDGSLTLQTQALSDANDQLDDDIAALEILLAQREQQMTNSFIRMEEMQSQIQSQQSMLDSSIANNFGQGASKK